MARSRYEHLFSPFSIGRVANGELLESLKGQVPEIYAIGDCDSPGLVPDATATGWRVASAM